MKIGLFHGYNLGGSGSNEYTRYLAKALLQKNAEIHLICREPDAESLGFIALRFATISTPMLKFYLTIRNKQTMSLPML